jgi:hypothetical protein
VPPHRSWIKQGHVELRVVGEHADHGPGVHVRAGQEPVRPAGHYLVRVREPRRRGRHLPGVAHGDVVAEELPGPGHRGGEVDRAGHQHPGRRRERVHEHAQVVAAPLTVLSVTPDAGQSLNQHPAHVVIDGRVQPGRARRARRTGVPAVLSGTRAGITPPAHRGDLGGVRGRLSSAGSDQYVVVFLFHAIAVGGDDAAGMTDDLPVGYGDSQFLLDPAGGIGLQGVGR